MWRKTERGEESNTRSSTRTKSAIKKEEEEQPGAPLSEKRREKHQARRDHWLVKTGQLKERREKRERRQKSSFFCLSLVGLPFFSDAEITGTGLARTKKNKSGEKFPEKNIEEGGGKEKTKKGSRIDRSPLPLRLARAEC